jgi:hypothetical protein
MALYAGFLDEPIPAAVLDARGASALLGILLTEIRTSRVERRNA